MQVCVTVILRMQVPFAFACFRDCAGRGRRALAAWRYRCVELCAAASGVRGGEAAAGATSGTGFVTTLPLVAGVQRQRTAAMAGGGAIHSEEETTEVLSKEPVGAGVGSDTGHGGLPVATLQWCRGVVAGFTQHRAGWRPSALRQPSRSIDVHLFAAGSAGAWACARLQGCRGSLDARTGRKAGIKHPRRLPSLPGRLPAMPAWSNLLEPPARHSRSLSGGGGPPAPWNSARLRTIHAAGAHAAVEG